MDTTNTSAPSPAHAPPSWVEESLERYANPRTFAKDPPGPAPEPVVQEEKVLTSPKGLRIKLVVSTSMDHRSGL